MSEKQYRSFHGIVQFDPREGQAGGKDVRNITIRATGVKEQSMRVGATLWPSHAHINVEKGDVVTVEGVFSRNNSSNGDGDKVVYNNLSVTTILVHGAADSGRDVDTVNTDSASDEADDDDIPY